MGIYSDRPIALLSCIGKVMERMVLVSTGVENQHDNAPAEYPEPPTIHQWNSGGIRSRLCDLRQFVRKHVRLPIITISDSNLRSTEFLVIRF